MTKKFTKKLLISSLWVAAVMLSFGLIFAGCDTGSGDTNPGGTVATPVADPPAGEVVSGATVTLSTTTEGATIYYTTNGDTPSAGSTEYTAPITITVDVTIKAIAIKSDMTDSAILTAEYTVRAADQVAEPVADPPAGEVVSGATVTLSTTTEGATIYYTTNGDTPSADSTEYTGPITITVDVTIKAIGVKDGWTDSAILTAGFTVAGLPQLTGTVSIIGTAEVGNSLSANTNDVDGTGALSYQWLISDSSDGNYSNIEDATDAGYTPGEDEVGKYIKLSVSREGYSGSVTSDPVGPVADLPELTGTVSITGTAGVWQPLKADITKLATQIKVSYQWKEADNSEGNYTNIEGATTQTYTPATADAGKYIKVSVTVNGYRGSVTSDATGQVAALSDNFVKELATAIGNLNAGSADAPDTLEVPATNISDNWAVINNALTAEKKYVILDLSDCNATNNTIAGSGNVPSGNYFNIIQNNTYIKGIILPDTLTGIGDYTFSQCQNLTCVNIPSQVGSIGNFAFLQCKNLTTLYVLPETPPTLGNNVFAVCTALTNIYVPSAKVDAYKAASGWSDYSTKISAIPDE